MELSIYQDVGWAQTARPDFYPSLPNYPLCAEDPKRGSDRAERHDAIHYSHIQVNPAEMLCWLVFDIDRDDGGAAVLDAGLPTPSWISVNPHNKHAHITYGLTAPVCKTDAARLHPIHYAEAVERGLRAELGADLGYSGPLTKNPTHESWRTIWPKSATSGYYDLGELAEYVNLKIPRPKVNEEIAGLGRNCCLFESLRIWSYPERKRQNWPEYPQWLSMVSAQAHSMNQFATPLPLAEVNCISRSVAKWTYQNITSAGYSAAQAKRGRKGGRKSKGGGRRKNPQSERQRQPWLDLGISEPTYYLWKRQRKL